MGCAATGHGRGCERAHGVGRVGRPVVGDDGRPGGVAAEVEAGGAVLLHVEVVGGLSQRPTGGGPGRRLVFDVARHGPSLAGHGVGVVHGETGHLLGDGASLGLVGVEDGGRRPAVEIGRQQPGQGGGIGDAGVHAVAGVRHPDVGGVAAQEHWAPPEAVGDESPAEPVLLADHVVGEVVPHAEDGADGPVAIDGVEVGVVGGQVVVDEPRLPAVDGVAVPRAAGVEGERGPRRRVSLTVDQRRGPDERGLHPLDDGVAFEGGTNPAPDVGPAAVAPHEQAAPDPQLRTPVEVGGDGLHPVLVLGEAFDPGPGS